MTRPVEPQGHLRSFLYIGLVLTVLVTAAPLIDMVTVDTVADHVRGAYPNWPAGSVAADRAAIVGYLGIVGILGIGGWLWSIRLVTRRANRARAAATSMFVLGALTALLNLTYGSGPYDRVVPMAYGLLGLLPVLAGAAAIVSLWRRRGTSLAHASEV